MSLTSWQPTVQLIQDGTPVDAADINPTLQQLIQRDTHLYEKFAELLGKSALISFGQPIHPASTFNVGELSVAYFKADNAGAGLAPAVTGFSSSASSSMYMPNTSNYVFGLIKTVYTQGNTADLYTSGLCELPVDLDHSTLGLLQKQADGSVEAFRVGPYFLSAKSPGKITSDPSGIPVYVGYALDKRKLLLSPNVDEFSQFFVNYRYHILDRVAGVPSLSGGHWMIGSVDLTKLGWIPASAAGVVSPSGAQFYYNIPTTTQLATDTGLTSVEIGEATELRRYLPPVPANFIQLSVNGVLARYNDLTDTNGVFSINEYGLWWHDNTDGNQPWASDYGSATPSSWGTIKTTVTRKHIVTSFAKFNPALRTQLVSSLAAFSTTTDNSANFIKLVSKDNIGAGAATGDLLLSVDPKFNSVGLDAPPLVFPSDVSSDYAAGEAVASLTYDKAAGVFKLVRTPVVAKLSGLGGITVNEASPGVWTVGYLSQGATGQVDSVEPINSRLEFRGLSSYIKLPTPSTTPYGLIGKILLPRGYPTNKQLRLVFHMFGDTDIALNSTARKVAFQFEYSSVSALNGVNPTGFTTVSPATYTPATNPVVVDLLAGNAAYTAYTSAKVVHADLTIPANQVTEDSVINYKLLRVATPTPGDSFAGNIGLLATYWEIPNN